MHLLVVGGEDRLGVGGLPRLRRVLESGGRPTGVPSQPPVQVVLISPRAFSKPTFPIGNAFPSACSPAQGQSIGNRRDEVVFDKVQIKVPPCDLLAVESFAPKLGKLREWEANRGIVRHVIQTNPKTFGITPKEFGQLSMRPN